MLLKQTSNVTIQPRRILPIFFHRSSSSFSSTTTSTVGDLTSVLEDIPFGQLSLKHVTQAQEWLETSSTGKKRLFERLIAEVPYNPTVCTKSQIKNWYHILLKQTSSSQSGGMELVQIMQQRHLTSPQSFPPPNRSTYHLLLQSFSNDTSLEYKKVCNMIQTVLDQMENENLITTTTYNIVLNVHANFASTEFTASQHAEDVLLEMTSSEYHPPDTTSFNTVLKAWSQHSSVKSAQRAQDILQLQLRFESVHPDLISFLTIFNAHSKSCTSLEYYVDHIQPLYHDVLKHLNKEEEQEADILRFWNQILYLLTQLQTNYDSTETATTNDNDAEEFFHDESAYIVENVLKQQFHIQPNSQTNGYYIQLSSKPMSILSDIDPKTNNYPNAQSLRFILLNKLSSFSQIQLLWSHLVINNQERYIQMSKSSRPQEMEKLLNSFISKSMRCCHQDGEQETTLISFVKQILQHWKQNQILMTELEEVSYHQWDVLYAYKSLLFLLSKHRTNSKKNAYDLLLEMEDLYQQGFIVHPPDTITYNLVLRTLAKRYNTTEQLFEKPVADISMVCTYVCYF